MEFLLNGTRVIVLKGEGGQGCKLSWGGLGTQRVQGLVTNYTDNIIIQSNIDKIMIILWFSAMFFVCFAYIYINRKQKDELNLQEKQERKSI